MRAKILRHHKSFVANVYTPRQRDLIHNSSWDILIVLDACRYDYFSKVYRDYFEGDLMKVISSGSATSEWLRNTFTSKYNDIIYISANPVINSLVPVFGFNARETFFKVIDVWNWAWNETLKTVLPSSVNSAVKKIFPKYSRKKIIIHYLQPHAPYLGLLVLIRKVSRLLDHIGNVSLVDDVIKTRTTMPRICSIVNNVINFVDRRITELMGFERVLKFRNYLGLRPRIPIEETLMWLPEPKNHWVRVLYELNLRIVMEYVAEISFSVLKTNPQKQIIITADHGELLGEGKYYDHPQGLHVAPLIEVPWFKIRKVKRAPRRSVLKLKHEIEKFELQRKVSVTMKRINLRLMKN